LRWNEQVSRYSKVRRSCQTGSTDSLQLTFFRIALSVGTPSLAARPTVIRAVIGEKKGIFDAMLKRTE
jgi:hypothetical protein